MATTESQEPKREKKKLTRAEASRANGKKSHGPTTQEGKASSSLNAFKHGLRSGRVVIPGESKEVYSTLLYRYNMRYQPRDQNEADLVMELFNARWRTRRCQSLEPGLYTATLAEMEAEIHRNFPNPSHNVLQALVYERMHTRSRFLEENRRAESRFHREYERAFRLLNALLAQQVREPVDQQELDGLESGVPGNDGADLTPQAADNPPVQPISTNEPEPYDRPPAGPADSDYMLDLKALRAYLRAAKCALPLLILLAALLHSRSFASIRGPQSSLHTNFLPPASKKPAIIGLAVTQFVVLLALAVSAFAQTDMARPKAGPVAIMPTSEIKPGMKATAWTVFEGTTPESVPIEIIGLWKNMWGPGQDIILGKMGGRAQRTNVAGGMSGSPVYVNGKLIGAVALRLSVFSPDAICGITPIELMTEINDFDKSRPSGAKSPDNPGSRAAIEIPGDLLAKVISAGVSPQFAASAPLMTPIDTPLTLSGFGDATLREFGPLMRQMGLNPVQGGASGALRSPKPVAGWQSALQPGDAVAGVLVSGDMSMTGLGTVSYNDGKRVLAFGHPFFNLGPVEMPMAKGEVLMTLSSAFQPNKIANATGIVGALHQDRHSGIMGTLGDTAEMIPVTLSVRSYNGDSKLEKTKDFKFHVFVQQRWTPFLMMSTLFNAVSQVNDFSDDVTYRLNAKVELDGYPNLNIGTMQAPTDMPIPAPMILAGWWGDKFNRLFGNAVKIPKLKSVNATVDLLPQRRIASIENAWLAQSELTPGSEVTGKVYLRPFRGDRVTRDFKFKLPSSLAKGEHRIMLTDADTLNRIQSAAGLANRYIDIPQTVSLINQERSNTRLYVALVEAKPTVYSDDKTMPSLPASVLNVMQSGSTQNRPYVTSGESATQFESIPFEFVVSGSYNLKVTVK